MNNYMSTNSTTQKKWTIFQNVQPIKTQSKRNRQFEQTNHKSEIQSVLKKLSANKSLGPDSFTGKFYQTYKELLLILLKLFQETEEEGTPSKTFYEVIIMLTPKPDKDTTKIENYRPISLIQMQKFSTKYQQTETHNTKKITHHN